MGQVRGTTIVFLLLCLCVTADLAGVVQAQDAGAGDSGSARLKRRISQHLDLQNQQPGPSAQHTENSSDAGKGTGANQSALPDLSNITDVALWHSNTLARLKREISQHINLQSQQLGPSAQDIENTWDAANGTGANQSALPDLGNITKNWDEVFSNDKVYQQNGIYLVVFTTLIVLEMFRKNLMGLLSVRICTRKGVDKYFNTFTKVTTTEIGLENALHITKSYPVIVQYEGNSPVDGDVPKGKPIKAPRMYPYNALTASYDGWIGHVVMEVENVPEAIVQDVKKNDILVNFNCQPFAEGTKEYSTGTDTMKWREVGLNDYLDEVLYEQAAVPLVFKSLETEGDTKLKPEAWVYCPVQEMDKDGERIQMYIEIVPKDESSTSELCLNSKGKRKLWPGGLMTPDLGIESWFEQYDKDHQNELADFLEKSRDDKAVVYGNRTDLRVHPLEGFTFAKPVGAICIVLLLVVSVFFTSETLRTQQSDLIDDPYAKRLSSVFMRPRDNLNANSATIIVKALTGIVIVTVTVGLRAVLSIFIVQLTNSNPALKRYFNMEGAMGFQYISVATKVILLIVALFTPPMLFLNSKYMDNTNGVVMKQFASLLTWINYFLAVVYFAQNSIEQLNFYLQLDMPLIMSGRTADLILGFTGLLAAVVEMISDTRENHGINDGCDLHELGNTFRLLNQDDPNTFPAGSEQELYCAESELTFADIYQLSEKDSTREYKNIARLDDGNMCVLTCTVEIPNKSPKMSSYPIWCKDNGFAGARWTLSSHRSLLSKRLCPHAGTIQTATQSSNPVIVASTNQPSTPPPAPSNSTASYILSKNQ